MKRFVMTVALCCAISGSALAGDVPSVDIKSPAPDEPVQITTSPGEIPTSGLIEQTSATILSFVQTMVGLIV